MPRRSLLWPDPRVKPPYGAAEIDPGHPLARGLIGAWLCNEGAGELYDLTRRSRASTTDYGSLMWTTSPYGLSSESVGGAGRKIIPASAALDASRQLSLASKFIHKISNTNAHIFNRDESATTRIFIIREETSTSVNWHPWHTGGLGTLVTGNSVAI